MTSRVTAMGWWDNAYWIHELLDKASHTSKPLDPAERKYLSSKGTRLTDLVRIGLGAVPEQDIRGMARFSDDPDMCALLAHGSSDFRTAKNQFRELGAYDATIQSIAEGNVPSQSDTARTRGFYQDLMTAIKKNYTI